MMAALIDLFCLGSDKLETGQMNKDEHVNCCLFTHAAATLAYMESHDWPLDKSKSNIHYVQLSFLLCLAY